LFSLSQSAAAGFTIAGGERFVNRRRTDGPGQKGPAAALEEAPVKEREKIGDSPCMPEKKEV
jgi:hypothetical protein